MRLFLILSFFVTLNASAIDTDKAAHLGVAYMATTMSYGMFKGLGMENRAVSSLFAATLVGMVSTMKELGDKRADGGDIAHNALGIGLSVGTIWAFEL